MRQITSSIISITRKNILLLGLVLGVVAFGVIAFGANAAEFGLSAGADYSAKGGNPEVNSTPDPTTASRANLTADGVLPPVAPGDLVISEFRVRGPNGATDEFVQLSNTTSSAITVLGSGTGTGFGVAASDGVVRCTIPNGTVIPAFGSYLCTNSVGYSLGVTATGDATYTTEIPDNAGIALFSTNVPAEFALATRLDAVGSTSEANSLYKEGTGYPALTPFSIDYSFFRDECGKSGSITTGGPCVALGNPKDTNNNAVDFVFVDTNGTSAGAGQRLGAPGPENLADPLSRGISGSLDMLPIDANLGYGGPDSDVAVPPNSVRDFVSDPPNNSTFGTLDLRYRYVNNSGVAITRLRFRVIDLTTFPAPSGTADLRPRTSTAVVVAGINDAATCAATGAPVTPPCTATIQGTTLEQPPSQPNGGGFNSTLSAGTVTGGTPLANGASLNVRFLLGLQQTDTSRICLMPETFPATDTTPVCFGSQQTIVVDDDGQGTAADCDAATPTLNTIQGAVDTASVGDIIKVCPGTYPEQVNVNKTLTMLGARSGVDARNASRTGLPATESVVTGVAGTTAFTIGADNVTLDGFTVQGNTNGNAFGAGIYMTAGIEGTDVINNIIQNNIIGMYLVNDSASNQAVIRQNVFRNNNNPGPASGTGIYTDEFTSGGTVRNVLIDKNLFSGNTGQGVALSSTDVAKPETNITISNNEFVANGRALYAFNLTNSSITTNMIRNSTDTGTADLRFFEGSSAVTVSCNTLENGAGRVSRISNASTGAPSATNITFTTNNFSGYANGGLILDPAVAPAPYSGTLTAENNYWGNPSGPAIASNPAGTGVTIVDPGTQVDFSPFSTAINACAPTPIRVNSVTTVTTSSNPSVFSQNVTFTATVTPAAPNFGAPSGSVVFVIDGTPQPSVTLSPGGTAAFSTSSLAIGPHTIVTNYGGDAFFNLSSGNLVQTVGNAETTTTVTAVPASPGVFGQPVTFTATVAVTPPGAGTPTGTVSFNIDGNLYCVNTPLNGSAQASCTQGGLPALPVGVRNVVAIYNGSATFNGSSGTLNYTVSKANTATTIVSSAPDPSLVNQPYTVTWSVAANPVQPNSGTPTGTVTVNGGTGGGSCTAAVSAGGCQLTPTTVGTKTIQATYNGDANFNTSSSATTSHTVHLRISGVVINGVTNAPVSGVTINLNNCATLSTTTGANGAYSFTGAFTGSCRLFPPLVNALLEHVYPAVTDNITNADFVIYTSLGDFPRRVSFPTQFVTPGAAGSMPVILKSTGNEGSVGFSFSYDANIFAQPPTVVCGANAPGCTISQDNSVFGKVGVTITPAGGVFTRPDGTPFDAPEQGSPEITTIPKEIAKINFQTLATTAPSTDFAISGDPTPRLAFETGTNNPLLVVYDDPARVVFAQGKEGDVAGRNTGNGVVDATDVVQVRRFVTGLDTPVSNFNEFQRADVAPATTKGDGVLDATDVIQARRFGTGLDTPASAGGPGLLVPAVAPPPVVERAVITREISVGSATTATGNRFSVPVELKANGDETAMSFTLRYDETKLGKPEVTLANALAGVTLTYNTDEVGLIRILIDANSPIANEASREAIQLLDVTFSVATNAPSGETRIEIADGVISDGEANALAAGYTQGTVTIYGPNPQDDGKGPKITRRQPQDESPDAIDERLNNSKVTLRQRTDRP